MSTKRAANAVGRGARKAKPKTKTAIAAAAQRETGPPFFVLVEGPTVGLHVRSPAGKTHHICGILRPLGECIDIYGRMAGVLVELVNGLRQRRIVVIPRDDLTPLRLPQFLVKHGLPIPLSNDKDRGRAILQYIDSEAPDRTHIVVDGDGWHTFPHPDQAEEIAVYALGKAIYRPEGTSLAVCRRQRLVTLSAVGANEALKELLSMIADDLIAVFLVCSSAASVLLRPLRHTTSLLFLIGSTSIGKSTALRLCASLFGDTHILTWHASKNGVNAVMRDFQDRVCVIDEVNQSTGTVFAEAAYDLTNDSSKLRATPSGSAAQTFRNINVILSAGEESPLALIRRSGRHVTGGQHARLLTVPVSEPHGVWTRLGRFASGAEKSAEVDRLATASRGAFVACFAQGVVDQVRNIESDFAKHACRLTKQIVKGMDLQNDHVAHRVLNDFTVFLYAGLVARDDGAVPWDRNQIVDAVRHAFALWHREYLRERPATGDDAMLRLKLFFQSQRSNRFVPLTTHAENHPGTLAGYEHTFRGESAPCFLVLPAFFKQQLCKDMDFRVAVNALKAQGLLRVGPRDCPTIQVHMPGTEAVHQTFYAVHREILAA